MLCREDARWLDSKTFAQETFAVPPGIASERLDNAFEPVDTEVAAPVPVPWFDSHSTKNF